MAELEFESSSASLPTPPCPLTKWCSFTWSSIFCVFFLLVFEQGRVSRLISRFLFSLSICPSRSRVQHHSLPQPCSPVFSARAPVFSELCDSFLIDPDLDPSLCCCAPIPARSSVSFLFLRASLELLGKCLISLSLSLFYSISMCIFCQCPFLHFSPLWGRVNSSNPSFFL